MSTWKRPGLIALSLLGIMLITASGGTRVLSEPASAKELNPDEVEHFRQLVQRYQTVYAHASVTGDVSEYPSVFYNDPTFDLKEYTPGCFPLIDDEKSETDAILSQFDSRPKGSDTGLLSCMIAEMVSYHRNVDAWQAEVDQAKAEGRNPSASNLDEGIVPMEPAQPEDAAQTASWDGPKHVIEAVYLDDSHVRFTYAEIPVEEDPGIVYHLLFTHVDGSWLISAIWNSFPGFE